MRAQILTLNAEVTTQEICQEIDKAMKQFNDECFINVVKKETSILYCATITNSKVNQKEAEIIYKAMELTRLFELERDFLDEDTIDILEPICEEIYGFIRTKRIHKLPKVTELLEELFDTFLE